MVLRYVEPIPLDEYAEHTPIIKDSPLAPTVIERSRQGWIVLRVVRCPFCGRKHEHGTGRAGDDPRAWLGGRVAHCHPNHPVWHEYRLIAIEPGYTKAELNAAFPLVAPWIESPGKSSVFPRPGERNPFPRVAFTAKDREAAWDKSGGRCWYCGVDLHPFRNFHIDHVHPIVRGGTNDPENLVPCCRKCNGLKGHQTLGAFRVDRSGALFWFEQREA